MGAAFFVMLAAALGNSAPANALPSTPTQDQLEATCDADFGTTDQPEADALFRAIEQVKQASGDVRTAIEPQTGYEPGWTETGEVASAIDALREDLQAMKAVARSILENREWLFDETDTSGDRQGEWQPAPSDLPLNPTLSLVSNEIWYSDAAFEQNISDLAALSDKESALEFWTQGASACATAASLIDFARSIDPTALAPTRELAETGAGSASMAAVALALVAGGGVLIALAGRLGTPLRPTH